MFLSIPTVVLFSDGELNTLYANILALLSIVFPLITIWLSIQFGGLVLGLIKGLADMFNPFKKKKDDWEDDDKHYRQY